MINSLKFVKQLQFYFTKEQRIIRKVRSFSEANPKWLVFIGDPTTETLVFARRGRIVPIQVFAKDSNQKVSLVSDMLNNNRRNMAMTTFLRYVDGAIYNLEMSDKKLDKKLEKLSEEGHLQFGHIDSKVKTKDQIAVKTALNN